MKQKNTHRYLKALLFIFVALILFFSGYAFGDKDIKICQDDVNYFREEFFRAAGGWNECLMQLPEADFNKTIERYSK